MVIDETGSLAGIKRHDYAPFGEELFDGASIRSESNGYGSDSTRQKFGSKERDNETGLDFFEARYYASNQGRFLSTDPIYFQAEMAIDPQRFNLYVYVRNNPLRLIDPSGEIVEARGDLDWLRTEVFVSMVGGQEIFDEHFVISEGEVRLRDWNVSRDSLNSGAQLLYDLVTTSDTYIYYAGTDGEEAANLFDVSGDRRRQLINQFTGRGYEQGVGTMIGTTGRGGQNQPLPRSPMENADRVHFALAFNTRLVIEQTGISGGEFANVEVDAQRAGVGQRVLPVSFFIHESAENLAFQGQRGEPGPYNYGAAHSSAMRREAIIKQELRIPGGFAGGQLRTTIPRER
jgi:RHS repeat-associated protein